MGARSQRSFVFEQIYTAFYDVARLVRTATPATITAAVAMSEVALDERACRVTQAAARGLAIDDVDTDDQAACVEIVKSIEVRAGSFFAYHVDATDPSSVRVEWTLALEIVVGLAARRASDAGFPAAIADVVHVAGVPDLPAIKIGKTSTSAAKIAIESAESEAADTRVIEQRFADYRAGLAVKARRIAGSQMNEAIDNDDVERVKLLVNAGYDVNMQFAYTQDDSVTRAALHAAASAESTDLVRWLLSSDADPNVRDSEGRTPLHEGARVLEIVRLLLEHRADPNVHDATGVTPLHLAAVDLAIVELLIEHGADPNAVTADGRPVMFHAAMNGEASIVQYLWQRGCDPRFVTRERETLLHAACRGGLTRLAKRLLSDGFDLHAIDAKGLTPLARACYGDHVALIRLLLASGAAADIEVADRSGDTPLHSVAECGTRAMAKLLVEHGAQIRARNHHKATPLAIAVMHGKHDIAAFLLEAGADSNERSTAFPSMWTGSEEKHYQDTPLLYKAAYTVDVRAVKLLLDAGADAKAVGVDRRTALHAVVDAGADSKAVAIIRLLRAEGASPRVVDANGVTPLDLANGSKSLLAALRR